MRLEAQAVARINTFYTIWLHSSLAHVRNLCSPQINGTYQLNHDKVLRPWCLMIAATFIWAASWPRVHGLNVPFTGCSVATWWRRGTGTLWLRLFSWQECHERNVIRILFPVSLRTRSKSCSLLATSEAWISMKIAEISIRNVQCSVMNIYSRLTEL